MNNLNSVLIEGELIKDLYTKNHNGETCYRFTISSNRFFKDKGSIEKETTVIDIEVGKKQAESASGRLKKGTGVRIVGRFKNERDNPKRIVIEAEHVELRPVFSKSDKNTASSEDSDND